MSLAGSFRRWDNQSLAPCVMTERLPVALPVASLLRQTGRGFHRRSREEM